METYERILLVKPEVFIYKIPPRPSARGYRAADWNLEKPDWVLRMRIVAKDKKCVLKLEDKTSGELFAECPVDAYPGSAVESVTDSSRYFVLKLQDPSGRSAFLGLGFGDRSDSFDMNVALQDHFKWVSTSEQISKEEASDNKPKLDLAFKQGEMIKINIGKKTTTSTKAPSSTAPGGIPGLLPPPPSGGVAKIAPPPNPNVNVDLSARDNFSSANNNSSGELFDLDPLAASNPGGKPSGGDWGEFSTANAKTSSSSSDASWMNF